VRIVTLLLGPAEALRAKAAADARIVAAAVRGL